MTSCSDISFVLMFMCKCEAWRRYLGHETGNCNRERTNIGGIDSKRVTKDSNSVMLEKIGVDYSWLGSDV